MESLCIHPFGNFLFKSSNLRVIFKLFSVQWDTNVYHIHGKMNSHGFFLQVIHLWFEDFSIEDSNTCEADFVTLKDELGTIGKSCAEVGHHSGKTISLPCRESEKKSL